MATDERLLRLENALVTLSDLAAKADARVGDLSGWAAKADARVGDLENHFRMLTELMVSASERMDTQMEWINTLGAGQANLDVKMAALADAQIRTEEALASLAGRVDKLANTIQKHIDDGT